MSIEIIFTILSAVTAILAIIIPAVTAQVGNRHQLKMHKIDFALNKKFELYQDFLEVLNLTLAASEFTLELSLEFKQAFSKIYLICDDATKSCLDELNSYIVKHCDLSDFIKNPEYRQFYNKVVKSMRNDLELNR